MFSIFGTLAGFTVGNIGANTRYIAPVIAGLIGGPLVGFGAGFLGGLHKWLYGGYAAPEAALSTVIVGVIAGIYYNLRIKKRDGFATTLEVAIIAFGVQVYHLGQVILVESFIDLAKAIDVVKMVAVPMLTANVLGAVIFGYIIENLYKEEKMRRERDNFLATSTRMENELKIAADIQLSMVPTVFVTTPKKDEFTLYATMKPAKEVGGDFYDFFLVDDNRLFLVVGDVSDKGVPAALFMAVTKTFIKSLAKTSKTPDQLLNVLNQHISNENNSLMFITIFCAYFDCHTGELEYSNAGHNPPFILRANGAVEKMEMPPGCVLGVTFGEECNYYSSKKIKLHQNDKIIVYTDGITEAKNPEKEFFGEERLIKTISSLAGKETEEIVHGIENAVTVFAGAAPQSDDITALALNYNKGKA